MCISLKVLSAERGFILAGYRGLKERRKGGFQGDSYEIYIGVIQGNSMPPRLD